MAGTALVLNTRYTLDPSADESANAAYWALQYVWWMNQDAGDSALVAQQRVSCWKSYRSSLRWATGFQGK